MCELGRLSRRESLNLSDLLFELGHQAGARRTFTKLDRICLEKSDNPIGHLQLTNC
jgi:hypothetical protein